MVSMEEIIGAFLRYPASGVPPMKKVYELTQEELEEALGDYVAKKIPELQGKRVTYDISQIKGGRATVHISEKD
jgi:hypothetical protein